MSLDKALGLLNFLIRIPHPVWRREAAHMARSNHSRISFLSEDHHKIRDFVVLELPRYGAPIPPEEISIRLNLPLKRTQEILNELEKGMTFLFRNAKGEVAWAYPVTSDPTPHRMRFNTGEQINAA
jgi:hypothetical protein